MCTYTQEFYENANNLYASIGMKGHGGIDINCGFGTDIEFPLDGIVSNVLNDVHKASDGYWGVYAICNYKGQLGELCVGHCSKINVKLGDKITKGQIIGQEGNHGYVFDNGLQITLAMQAAGDQRGHHRHWQWRPILKVSVLNNKQFITNYNGFVRDPDGSYYQVLDYDNGYHGLSPIIGGILSDYTNEKNLSTTPSPVQPDVDIMKEQGIFITILNSFINILKSLKSSLK